MRELRDLQTASENREDLEEQNIQSQKEKERKIAAKVTPDRERPVSVSVKRNLPEDISQDSRSGRHTDPLTGEMLRGRSIEERRRMIAAVSSRCTTRYNRTTDVPRYRRQMELGRSTIANIPQSPADLSVIRLGRSRRARAVTSDRVQVRCQRDRGRASRSNDGPADCSPRANRPFKFMGLSRRLRLDRLIWLVYSLLCREVPETTFHSRVLAVLTLFHQKIMLKNSSETNIYQVLWKGSLHSRFIVDESLSSLTLFKIISPSMRACFFKPSVRRDRQLYHTILKIETSVSKHKTSKRLIGPTILV